jgi:VIT1/CCC1 family predicted Fe2+/Mn2+ transporter
MMRNGLNWLHTNRYIAHLVAFLLMALPPLPMYYFAQQGATGWVWTLLVIVILGNLIALFTR